MKALRAIAKTFILSLGVISLVAVAETYYDRKFYTADFMDEVNEVNLSIPAPAEKRIVASEAKKLPLIQNVSLVRKSEIDGKWQITRVLNEKGNVIYDVFNNSKDSSNYVEVNFELINLSTIQIDQDIEQTYRISLLTAQGTIGLFKEFGDGYEVVEARKVSDVKKGNKELSKGQEVEDTKKPKYDIQDDLFLVSGLDPKKNRNVLRGNDVEGYAYLKNGELILENISLHMGTKNQTESFSTEARIMGHGTFNDGRGSQGIITNISNNEIKVRLSTGPLSGAMLNFVTYDKKMEIEGKFGGTTQQVPEAVENAQASEAQEYAQDQAQVNQEEPIEKEEVLIEAEVKEEEMLEEEYREDEGYGFEEVNGERFNEPELEYEEYQEKAKEFENERREAGGYERRPSSEEMASIGFSF